MGYTSNDVVQKVRKALHTKKVGHAGTLDPLATGVLPILIGQGTKLSKYLIEHDKTYIATINLGEKKDTGDAEGQTIQMKPVEKLEVDRIKKVLASFLGKQKQIPPMYSAIKKEGKKLYEYARKGIEIERDARDIEIKQIELIDYQDNRSICFEVSCSKGTYIRVLCENIAEKLNTVGYMTNLVRTRVNEFTLANTVTLEELANIEKTKKGFYSIEQIFSKQKEIVLEEKKLMQFLNGVLLPTQLLEGIYRIYNLNKDFIGLGIVKNNALKRDIVIFA